MLILRRCRLFLRAGWERCHGSDEEHCKQNSANCFDFAENHRRL
jgi:hypothetical protein